MAKSNSAKLKEKILERFPPRFSIKKDRIRKNIPNANQITEVYLLTESKNVYLTARGKDFESALKALDEMTSILRPLEAESQPPHRKE